ncbi:serine palmitoyltransferase 1-like [Halichondria panicea]|uniref:serine palmitoyltransferase 1-like n=1 Tax=Halichondria panicea TaxID=6063 RepID=UPI00312B6326
MSSSEFPVTVFEAIKAYLDQAPTYHVAVEAILIAWICYLLLFSKRYRPQSKHDKLSKEEEDELIGEWNPEPLVPDGYPSDREVDPSPIVTGTAGAHITVNGKECLNLATLNFLGLLENSTVKEAAARSIQKYGVGSCGPRGFYGTVDVHLELEKRLAKFTQREETILYSYGFAAVSSCIPAYSKRRDIIFVDEGVAFSIQKGLVASRSKLKYFKHNDMADLHRLLEEQRKLDEKNPAKAKVTRKFMVAEALYYNWGDLAPLPKLVEFRNKYRIPLILDESVSFGVLGATGRGATEHFELDPEDVDIMCVSLDMAVASVGGFCAGKAYVIDHQRLSGLGYCFSASVPPMMASAAIEGLNIMEGDGSIFTRLRANAKKMRELLFGVSGVEVCGLEACPVIHLRVTTPTSCQESDQQLLQTIADECIASGVAIVTAKYLDEEYQKPPPSLRLTVSSEHTEAELTTAAGVIKQAIAKHILAS